MPFYIDLKSIFVPASLEATARDIAQESQNQTAHAQPVFNRAARVDAAFAEAAESFEDRMLQSMHIDLTGLLLEYAWRILRSLGLVLPAAVIPASQAASTTIAIPSIARHLQRFMDAAKSFQYFLRAMSFFYGPRGCIPVLIVDEVDLLDASDLSVVRHEFVAFLFQHASAKSMAPVVIVLLSSDATDSKILKSCELLLFCFQWGSENFCSVLILPFCAGGGEYNLAKLFHHERVGDVPKKHLKDFIAHLSAGTTQSFPGLSRWRERNSDKARFEESFRLCEHVKLVMSLVLQGSNTPRLLFADGGFVNDWIRLYDAQLQDEGGRTRSSCCMFTVRPLSFCLVTGSDIVLSDTSDVHHLVSRSVDVVGELSAIGLDLVDVIQTFRAITESQLSPRGANLLDSLVYNHSGRSVPSTALWIMSEKNLIEIRDGNPDVSDYTELAPFAQEVYVCATRPLARTSMRKVIMALEEEKAKLVSLPCPSSPT